MCIFYIGVEGNTPLVTSLNNDFYQDEGSYPMDSFDSAVRQKTASPAIIRFGEQSLHRYIKSSTINTDMESS